MPGVLFGVFLAALSIMHLTNVYVYKSDKIQKDIRSIGDIVMVITRVFFIMLLFMGQAVFFNVSGLFR